MHEIDNDLEHFTELNIHDNDNRPFDPFAEISITDSEPIMEEIDEPAVEDNPPNDIVTNLVDEAINVFDNTSTETQDIRRRMLGALSPCIEQIDFMDGQDDESYGNKLRLLEQTRQILNDLDNSARHSANLKLKKATLDEQHQSNINVVEILSKINLTQSYDSNRATWAMNDVNHPVFANENELANQLASVTQHEVISDGELEISDSKLPRPDKDKDENDPFSEN